MEARLGHDFSSVRVHRDAAADRSARAQGAEAFAYGDQITFAGGAFAPATWAGRRLLAHELTHVVQQRAGVALDPATGEPRGEYERQAEAAAAGGRLPVVAAAGRARSVVQRQPQPKGSKAAPPVAAPQLAVPGLFEMLDEWGKIDAIKAPLVSSLAHAYVTRPGAKPPPTNTPWDFTLPKEPTEYDVYDALYRAMDLAKTGKGAKDWTLAWKDRPKTQAEKKGEVDDFLFDQAGDQIGDIAKATGVELGAWAMRAQGAEILAGAQRLGPGALKVAAERVGTRWVIAAKLLTTGFELWEAVAGPVGWAMLALEVVDLANSLEGPSEQSEIVAGVKAWLEAEQTAREARAAISHPRPYSAAPDRTSVDPRRFPPGR